MRGMSEPPTDGVVDIPVVHVPEPAGPVDDAIDPADTHTEGVDAP